MYIQSAGKCTLHKLTHQVYICLTNKMGENDLRQFFLCLKTQLPVTEKVIVPAQRLKDHPFIFQRTFCGEKKDIVQLTL